MESHSVPRSLFKQTSECASEGNIVKLPNNEKTHHFHAEETLPYSERRIENLEELALLMQAMDQDEGIRIVGEVEGFKNGGFIFVAKSGDRHCVNVCDRILNPDTKTYAVGGNDLWLYFESFEEAWDKLKTLVRNPLEAYAY